MLWIISVNTMVLVFATFVNFDCETWKDFFWFGLSSQRETFFLKFRKLLFVGINVDLRCISLPRHKSVYKKLLATGIMSVVPFTLPIKEKPC